MRVGVPSFACVVGHLRVSILLVNSLAKEAKCVFASCACLLPNSITFPLVFPSIFGPCCMRDSLFCLPLFSVVFCVMLLCACVSRSLVLKGSGDVLMAIRDAGSSSPSTPYERNRRVTKSGLPDPPSQDMGGGESIRLCVFFFRFSSVAWVGMELGLGWIFFL